MPEIDGDIATSKVLSYSFFSMGLEAITGGKKAFINFTQNLLKDNCLLMFPKEKIVVELIEDIEPEESTINACKEIKKWI